MNKVKQILVAALIVSAASLKGQQLIAVAPNDIIKLVADEYRGEIQWQVSEDEQSWVNIENAKASPFEITVATLPAYYRARIIETGCDQQHFSEVIQVVSNQPTAYWSDLTTWQGSKPVAGEDVTIEGYVILDENTPALGTLTVNGILAFERKDILLNAKRIIVKGKLEVGTEAQPFSQHAIITLTGGNTAEGGNDRGIMVMSGGTLELHGATPEVLWTKLNAHLPMNGTELTLQEPVQWDSNGEIVMAPTDFYEAGLGKSITQRVGINSVDGNKISIATGSNSHRWGQLQYATNEGMSLDANAQRVETPPVNMEAGETPTILDERAEIGYLTRKIVIQSIDDDLWKNVGFGCHVMIMKNATAHVEGVEIKRGGQRAHIGRYPYHWHNLSYTAPETLEDATGQYFKNSVINESSQRGVVIHGTNGVLVDNNIIYKVQGHGIFTEDAVERRNIINHNLVLHVRNPPWNKQLKNHEQGGLHDGGSSAFWISNPDNTITNNAVADCIAFGYWLAFTTQAWGDNIGVLHEDGFLLRPNRLRFGVFENNVVHSVKLRGIMLDLVESSNEGDVTGAQYYSTSDGRDPSWPFSTLERFTLASCTVYKCGHNGFWDRSTYPNTFGFVSADNCGRFFAGAGAEGRIEHNLVIGTSLNHQMNGTGRASLGYTDFYRTKNGQNHEGSEPVAFASYHHTFVAKENVVINFPLVAGKRSGTFDMSDYYIRGLEKGQIRNADNILVNSHGGYKAVAPDAWYTLSSAVWDPHGVWGEEGNYLVDNDPFLTYGKEVTPILPDYESTGAVSVAGPFYSFRGFVLYGEGDELPKNQHYFDLWNIHVSRMDQSLNEVATWTVQGSTAGALLTHMKDFVTSPDGIYELTFPNLDLPYDFRMLVDNMLTSDDTQMMSIAFDGTITNLTVGLQAFGTRETYSQLNSLEEVRNSAGATYWQDSANNRIWTKLRGGIWKFYTNNPNEAIPNFEDTTYEQLVFFIRQSQ